MSLWSIIRRGAHGIKHGTVVTVQSIPHIVDPALIVASAVVPELAPLETLIKHLIPKSDNGGELMNPLETMAIMMVMGVIQTTVKNPTHAAAMKTHLLGVADSIYSAYGLVPPSVAVPTAPTGADAPTPGK